MILRDLFEKEEPKHDEEEVQKIDIRDPRTKWLVNKARAKYAYADTDLEAFVQFMRDEVDDEKERIQANTDNIDTEHEVNIKQQQDLDTQEKINKSQEQHLRRLDQKEAEIDSKLRDMTTAKQEFDKIKDNLKDIKAYVDMNMDKMDQATLSSKT